jgi:serine/threonine protein kinase
MMKRVRIAVTERRKTVGRLLAPETVLRRRYKIIAPVGQGGMGAVYRAEDLRLEGRICAVKEVRPDPDASPEALAQAQEQFHREASILARLDHPNLPKVSDMFVERRREYLVMDFVSGWDLRQLVEEKRRRGEFLSEERVLRWVDQLCHALEYLHSQNPPILHRDIKPANIKLAPSGLIKLVDFGLVKLMAGDDSSTVTVLQGRGTVAYTPLEQYGGDTGHTDVRSDIYSLGATLYHLLTNQPPADAKQRFLNPNALVFPRTIHPGLSPITERAILAAIAMHPDPRPQNVAAFRELLHASSLPPTLYSLVPAQGEWRRAVTENRRLLLFAGVMFVLAMLATFL